MKQTCLLVAAFAICLTASAQTRYLNEVFSDVNVTSNIQYGTNITVITALQGLAPAPQPLMLDLYEPAGDTETDRPLLLYFHTGNFLPQYVSGSPLGTKTDSATVEICTRYAKMGYVVASVDYRLGWNPTAATQSERTLQLIQAAYRGVQDSRTAVRFFRKSVAEEANLYGVDDSKIAMLGEGTGGYITLASTGISSYADIILDDAGAPIEKFYYDPGDGSSIPMVIESIHGDPNATTDTYAPASSGGFQLCMANHVGYSSEFNFQMNLGGALGDLNWLDEGDNPMVSFHCPHDPFAPYETAVLIVPTTSEPVVEVSGAYDIHQEISSYATNNNAVFADADIDDAASANNGGWDGLFPVLNSYNEEGVPTEPFDSSPWQWWSEAATQAYDDAYGTTILATQLTLNPTMGEAEAMGWIDQIMDYNTPRMGLALGTLTEGQINSNGVRYIDEVFPEVTVTSNVQYGTNITVITALQGLAPAPQPLMLDLYEPTGDTQTNRPLILYFHTGNFLPQYVNGSALGTKTDSATVAICTEFAKKGYVVASCDYRAGWNPTAATQSERTLQLIQAAYRGVQDSRTAVRFFRKSVAEDNNPFGVGTDKIAMFGEGTGGYITLASAGISGYNDIILDDAGAPIAKFFYDPGDGSSIPMVIESIHGDPNATTDTYAPASSGGFQLCMANHVGYSSEFNFQMNMGGALGDLNWLDEGDSPSVSFHAPHDQFAPYTTGVLVVPTTSEPVVEVSGAYDIHAEINGYATNNNAVFAEIGLPDPAAALGNQGWDGLYPVMNNYDENNVPLEPFDGSPWQWWDVATTEAVDAANGTTIAATQLTLNPTMGPAEASYWIDVIADYTAPRLAVSLDLAELGPGCTDEGACNYSALSTTDDGSCEFAAEGFDCEGNSLIVPGCTDVIACNYDGFATEDDGSCDYMDTVLPTGAENVWLVGLTLTGTENEPLAGGCEVDGGVNPNVAVNGVFLGDGTGGPLVMSNISDPTGGLLALLVGIVSTTPVGMCGSQLTVNLSGNILTLAQQNGVWKTIVPVLGTQFLWAAPMANFTAGCGDPTACGFTNPCDLSLLCDYTDTDGDDILDCQEIAGCGDENADNYNVNATDPGPCNYNGCTDSAAVNYDEGSNTDDGSCQYEIVFRVNASNVTVDGGVAVEGSFGASASAMTLMGYGVWETTLVLGDGSYTFNYLNGTMSESISGDCDAQRALTVAGAPMTLDAVCYGDCGLCAGCTDPFSAEYNPFAGSDDGSCATMIVAGCTYADADNYNPGANLDDGSCEVSGTSDCVTDLDGDGATAVGDLLLLLGSFGSACD
jgi:acetyl esterase/lipase